MVSKAHARFRRRRRLGKNKVQDKRIAKLEKIVATREPKYQDTAGTGVVPTWGGALGNLIAPTEAVTDVGRLGDKIAIEKIEFRINGGMTTTTPGTVNQFRFIIIRDKAGGLGTTPANVLDSSVISTANACNAPFEEDLRKNFEVLYDRTFLVDVATNYQFQSKYIKKYKTPKVMYLNNNTTTANKGQIKLLTISDQLAPNVAYDYFCRVWFSDL